MQVQVLGSGAGGPFQGRHYSAQIVQVYQHYFLVDCGEGTQEMMFRFGVKSDRIRQIFISHLHGDHVFGLAGLITSFCLKKRTAPLELFGPAGLQELIECTFRISGVKTPFELCFHAVDTTVSALVFENSQLEVWTVPLLHRTACTGWLFREKPRLRNIRKDKIGAYDLPYSVLPALKRGEDLVLPDGRIVPNETLTLAPPPPASFAYCSDTAFSTAVAEAVSGVDLLYHEATFTSEHLEEAAIAFHSTAAQAAEIARLSGAGKLLMGHFSARYKNLEQHLAEACAVFPASYAVEEGGIYSAKAEDPDCGGEDR